MTKAEHDNAKALEDDGGIREIIQSARVMSLSAEERAGTGQMAALTTGAEQLWGREGWNGRVKHRRQRGLEDVTDHGALGRVVEEEEKEGDEEEDENHSEDHKRQRLVNFSAYSQQEEAVWHSSIQD